MAVPKKLNATQTKNDLLGAMTPFVKQNATSGKSYSDTVNMLWDNMDESDRQSLSLSDVQSQVKRVYELNGIDIKGGSDASGIGSALFGGFGEAVAEGVIAHCLVVVQTLILHKLGCCTELFFSIYEMEPKH